MDFIAGLPWLNSLSLSLSLSLYLYIYIYEHELQYDEHQMYV